MKYVFVAMRVVKFNGGVTVTYAIGVFTDERDAQRASEEAPRAFAGATQPVRQALAILGIVEIGGGFMKLPYTAGSGLELPGGGALISLK